MNDYTFYDLLCFIYLHKYIFHEKFNNVLNIIEINNKLLNDNISYEKESFFFKNTYPQAYGLYLKNLSHLCLIVISFYFK